MPVSLSIQVALVLTVCAAMWPARGQACTCNPAPIFGSTPDDGARDVARNQAISVEGAYVAGSIVFEDADGNAVEYDAIKGPTPGCPGTSAELVPLQPLRPDTTNVVRVQAMIHDANPGKRLVESGRQLGNARLCPRALLA